MALHVELETRLAAFKKTEATVVFQSGFAANAGTVAAILTKDDVVVSDELNHASIIDGCRLSRATIKVFPHKEDRKSTRLNSSHVSISYAVFCVKKKKNKNQNQTHDAGLTSTTITHVPPD